jgi:hypothetical protein
MDHAFKDLIDKFMEYYQYDLTIHSKIREKHIHHLREVFQIYRLYGIYLNLKNVNFLSQKEIF